MILGVKGIFWTFEHWSSMLFNTYDYQTLAEFFFDVDRQIFFELLNGDWD